jgi:hypothetical protein
MDKATVINLWITWDSGLTQIWLNKETEKTVQVDLIK